jgi:hypothetical protein
LYVERWLKAPVQKEDGTLVERNCGSPQGSAISPLLANLFMHYGFDSWMARTFRTMRFERYCDDLVVHCVSSEPDESRGSRPVCAVRRVIISPAQPGDTRRRCLGYQLTCDRKINGTGACWEKGATVGRRCTAGCVRPGRHGEGLIA